MFFMFHILVLIIYISGANNNVLKKKHIQEEVTDLEDNEHRMNIQDVQNNSRVFPTYKPLFQIIHDLANTKSPNLKSNVFDKRLSDEMFSIKQHGYEKDMAFSTLNLVNHKSNPSTPTLELKQKWPIVDLLFQADNIPGSLQYIDEFEKMYLINSTTELNESSTTENIVTDDHQKEKDKVVGLRSLSGNAPSLMPGRMYHSMAIKQCTCPKTNPTTTRSALRTGSSTSHKCSASYAATTPHKCTASSAATTKDCTRKIVTKSILPFYVPYDILSITTNFPSFYYPPYVSNEVKIPKPLKHRKPPRPSIEEDLYYEDSFEREKYENERYDDNDDDDYLEHDRETLNKYKFNHEDDYIKHEREPLKKNEWKNEKENLVIVEYDEPEKDKKISWNTQIHNENPDVLANNILDDLQTQYSDTIIKKCYCSSTSCYVTFTSVLILSMCLFMLNLF